MMNPYKVISSIFSDDGFKISNFVIKVENETSIDVYKNNDSIVIDFQENQPTITVNKIIKLKITVEGIELSKDGGSLKLDRFPDIPFKYEWLEDEQND